MCHTNGATAGAPAMYRAHQICSPFDPMCGGLRRGAVDFGALFVDLREKLGKYVRPLGVSRLIE